MGLKDGDTLRSEGGRKGGSSFACLFSRPFYFSTVSLLTMVLYGAKELARLGCRCFSVGSG
jgi:hypothetical protein